MHLTVPPNIMLITERDVSVTEPGLATFSCTAMAKPRPTITWYRVELNHSRNIISGTEEGSISVVNGDTERTTNSTLVLYSTRPFFSTMYICEATNLVSSAEINATLNVLGISCDSNDFCDVIILFY